MQDMLLDTVLDTLQIVPFLFLIYLFLEYLQKEASRYKINTEKLNRWGPAFGGVVGCIPQCGFSAAAATLYSERLIKAGTLIAVFLATSDEAIPVLLSSAANFGLLGLLILVKLIVAVSAGYLLNYTLFRHEAVEDEKQLEIEFNSCESHEHHEHKTQVFKNAIFHTFKISLYILVTLLIINILIFFLGEEKFSSVLLSGNILQPFVTAFIGMIPGCSVSVLITQLLISGDISIGAGIAGLCAGAGFGYIILFQKSGLKSAFKILTITYGFSVLAGLVVNFIIAVPL